MQALNVGHWVALIVLIGVVWFLRRFTQRNGKTVKISTGIVMLILAAVGFFLQGAPVNMTIGAPPLMVYSQWLFATVGIVFGIGGIIILMSRPVPTTDTPSVPG